MKKYTSFQQLDKDIRRAHLQSQISKEELVLQANQTKEKLYPNNILTNAIGSVTSSKFASKIGVTIGVYLLKKLLKTNKK
ncbi:MAG: hypothetical protein ACI849_000623 [Patiriisocius sp.]|jgi:hypothetical protein